MLASELKQNVEASGNEPYFFTRETMRFFGDTMRNYGVYKTAITTLWENKLEVYALYRKKPVKCGLQSTAYFNAKTFKREHKK